MCEIKWEILEERIYRYMYVYAGVLASQEKSQFRILFVKSQEIELFFRKSQEKSGF